MQIRFFELEINGKTLLQLGDKQLPSKGSGWLMVGLRIPSITLPFQKRNNLGEWERTFALSLPTLFQVTNITDISWEMHKRVLGFGFAVCYQYGY
jgi:hypothetical protein